MQNKRGGECGMYQSGRNPIGRNEVLNDEISPTSEYVRDPLVFTYSDFPTKEFPDCAVSKTHAAVMYPRSFHASGGR